MRTVLVITGSQEKFSEIKRYFKDIPDIEFRHKDLDLTEIQELNERAIMEHKLREAARHVHGEFLVDDTSFHIDALNGFPGPLIKWMRQSLKEEGIWDLASRYENRHASVTCTIGYGDSRTDPARFEIFQATVSGTIVSPIPPGYGFDQIFIPEGQKKRFSEMTTDEKNACGHRGMAARKVLGYLKRKA